MRTWAQKKSKMAFFFTKILLGIYSLQIKKNTKHVLKQILVVGTTQDVSKEIANLKERFQTLTENQVVIHYVQTCHQGCDAVSECFRSDPDPEQKKLKHYELPKKKGSGKN